MISMFVKIAFFVIWSSFLAATANAITFSGDPVGACCLQDGQCLDEVTSFDCTVIFAGTYQGDGSDCITAICPQPPEACCIGVDNCVVVILSDCTALGGQSMGPGTDCEISPCVPAPCNEDFNADGQVNVTDLLALLAAWGPCLGCIEDSNGDGSVNVTDLLALLAAWGACP